MAAISPSTDISFTIPASHTTLPLNSYLITYKDITIVCKTYNRTRAIDMALMTDEIGDKLSKNSLTFGRPVSNYSQIPDLQVMQIRPWHRIHTDHDDNNHMYMRSKSFTKSKLSVFQGDSTVMDFATTIGAFDKIKIYTDSEKLYSPSTYDSYDLQTPVNSHIDPFEFV